MTIDYNYVRRVVLNDRMMGYKPDRASLEKISSRLPDARVIGFGRYHVTPLWTTWFLLVESKKFWADFDCNMEAVSINQLPGYTSLLSAVPNSLPTKPAG